MKRPEAPFNTTVKNSLFEGHKIADNFASSGGHAGETPFDGFGIFKENDTYFPCYWESKYKSCMEAFNLNLIEGHQAIALSKYSLIPNAKTFLILGLKYGRGDERAYVFDWKSIEHLYINGFSFHAKFLEKFPFNQVDNKTKTFKFDTIITKAKIIEIYGEGVYNDAKSNNEVPKVREE